jgi:hypothetical protein
MQLLEINKRSVKIYFRERGGTLIPIRSAKLAVYEK